VISLDDVLDPLTGDRVTVEASPPAGRPVPTAGRVDGSHLWVLPGLYDADQNWPVPATGVREGDRWRALTGGAAHVNTAYPWDRIAPSTPAAVAAAFEPLRFPQVFPVLTVPRDRSRGFAPWLAAHASELRDTWPPVCRLFSGDPELDRNLKAVWDAGLRVAVFCGDAAAVEQVLAARRGPLHFRHATSAGQLARMLDAPGTTAQTSPHFLLALEDDVAAGLHVRPPVPGEPDRAGLVAALDRVAMIGTDHNAPVLGHEGPGLDVAATLLSTLLALAAEVDGGLTALVPKVTTGAAGVFGTADRLRPSRIVVDPAPERVMSLAPGQEARRSPYLGLRLRGAVVAVVTDGEALYV
jgi:hypothetical protein